MWATFSFNLSCDIVALQVETHCCMYYRMREQLARSKIVLQAEKHIEKSVTTEAEASTCLTTSLNSTLVIGCQWSVAMQQIKKNHGRWRRQAWSYWSRPETLGKSEICPIQREDLESYCSLCNTSYVPSKSMQQKEKGSEEWSQKYNLSLTYLKRQLPTVRTLLAWEIKTKSDGKKLQWKFFEK